MYGFKRNAKCCKVKKKVHKAVFCHCKQQNGERFNKLIIYIELTVSHLDIDNQHCEAILKTKNTVSCHFYTLYLKIFRERCYIHLSA